MMEHIALALLLLAGFASAQIGWEVETKWQCAFVFDEQSIQTKGIDRIAEARPGTTAKGVIYGADVRDAVDIERNVPWLWTFDDVDSNSGTRASNLISKAMPGAKMMSGNKKVKTGKMMKDGKSEYKTVAAGRYKVPESYVGCTKKEGNAEGNAEGSCEPYDAGNMKSSTIGLLEFKTAMFPEGDGPGKKTGPLPVSMETIAVTRQAFQAVHDKLNDALNTQCKTRSAGIASIKFENGILYELGGKFIQDGNSKTMGTGVCAVSCEEKGKSQFEAIKDLQVTVNVKWDAMLAEGGQASGYAQILGTMPRVLYESAETNAFVKAVTEAGLVAPDQLDNFKKTWAVWWHELSHLLDGDKNHTPWYKNQCHISKVRLEAKTIAPDEKHRKRIVSLCKQHHAVLKNYGDHCNPWNDEQVSENDLDVQAIFKEYALVEERLAHSDCAKAILPTCSTTECQTPSVAAGRAQECWKSLQTDDFKKEMGVFTVANFKNAHTVEGAPHKFDITADLERATATARVSVKNCKSDAQCESDRFYPRASKCCGEGKKYAGVNVGRCLEPEKFKRKGCGAPTATAKEATPAQNSLRGAAVGGAVDDTPVAKPVIKPASRSVSTGDEVSSTPPGAKFFAPGPRWRNGEGGAAPPKRARRGYPVRVRVRLNPMHVSQEAQGDLVAPVRARPATHKKLKAGSKCDKCKECVAADQGFNTFSGACQASAPKDCATFCDT